MASSSILKFILLGEDKTGGAFKSAASGMDVLAKKSTDVGKSLTLGVTAPLTAIAAVGIKTASDFGVTMASMQVNAGLSAEKMEELRGLALKMGADTVYSANEAGQAMLELSKAGVSTADIQGGALAGAMNLAATEGIDLAESATIVSNALNTFGLKGTDAAKVADLLAAGAVASSAGVQDLAAGMKYAGSTAQALDIPMDSVVTALAALNSAGIDSTTAGTSFNRFMLGLIPKSELAAKTMKALRTEFTNVDGSLKTMPEILQELKDGLDDLPAPTKMKALKDMFGVEGARAAIVLMEQGVEGWNALSTEVNKGGVAADLANARMSGMAGAIEMMKGSLETAALTIGEALAPKVEYLSGKITTLVNWFTDLDSGTKSVVVNFGIAAAAIGPLLWGFGKAIQVGQTMVTGLKMIHTTWQIGAAIARVYSMSILSTGQAFLVSAAHTVAHTAAMVAHKAVALAVAAASKIMAVAQWALNAAMTANPIGLVIAALAALAVGLKYAWDHSETFRNIVTNGFKIVGTAVLTLAGVWLTGVKGMVDIYLGFVEAVISGAARAFGWIPGIGPKLKEAAAKFGEFRDTVGEQFDKATGKVNEFKGKLNEIDGKKVDVTVDVHWSTQALKVINSPGFEWGKGRAAGGLIRGTGTGTSDSIPAMLSNGEYVVRASAVDRIGVAALDAMNSGGGGGSVSTSGGSGGGVTVNVYGGMDSAETIARRVQTALLDLKRRQGVNLGLA